MGKKNRRGKKEEGSGDAPTVKTEDESKLKSQQPKQKYEGGGDAQSSASGQQSSSASVIAPPVATQPRTHPQAAESSQPQGAWGPPVGGQQHEGKGSPQQRQQPRGRGASLTGYQQQQQSRELTQPPPKQAWGPPGSGQQHGGKGGPPTGMQQQPQSRELTQPPPKQRWGPSGGGQQHEGKGSPQQQHQPRGRDASPIGLQQQPPRGRGASLTGYQQQQQSRELTQPPPKQAWGPSGGGQQHEGKGHPQQRQQPRGRGASLTGYQQQQQSRELTQPPPKQAWGPPGGGQQHGGKGGPPTGMQQQPQSRELTQPPPKQAWGPAVRGQPQQQKGTAGDGQSQSSSSGQKQTHTAQQQQLVPSAAMGSPKSSLATSVTKLYIDNFPKRRNAPAASKEGIPIDIETNHLEIKFNLKNTNAIHYDVQITPETPKRLLPMAMEKFRLTHFPTRYPAYDGRRNLYSTTALFEQQSLSDEVTIVGNESDRKLTFKIQLQFTTYVDLQSVTNYMAANKSGLSQSLPQAAIQCLDVVFRSAPMNRFTRVGRSFFTPPSGQIINLGNGMELWYGFFQSAILGWKPYLNVDVAHKGFPIEQPVINLIAELERTTVEYLRNELNPYTVKDLNDIIKGLKVMYVIPSKPTSKRMYRVNGVVDIPRKLIFTLENKGQMTVQQYFQTEKQHKLEYPNLPCLHVGNPQKKIYVPVELCTVMKGQVTNRKLTEEQTRNMIRHAATPTSVRKQKIQSALSSANFQSSPCLKEFGVSIANDFAKIKARIIPAPAIAYRNEEKVMPRLGVWRERNFYKTNPLTNWSILNLDDRTRIDSLKRFETMVLRTAESVGMNIYKASHIETLRYNPRDVREILNFFNQIKKSESQLLFIVLPGRNTSFAYSKVKQLAELSVGVLTQCMQSKTMYNMKPATVTNILFKVNAKLNGTNHILGIRPPILLKPCMIVGADVTHPSPDQRDIPSVAAVAASHDPNAACYNYCWRLQPPRVEIIEDLQNIIREQLIKFYKKTGNKPQTILFFRDGVSEGQFKEVFNAEITAIQNACRSMSEERYEPKITFLVVQKRHHTRFFPVRPEDGDRKNGNVPPGTCVDTDITHPTDIDFYLCSHASLQGVSRPTRYRVLWDDNGFSEDALEMLTYFLCHVFTRCTRSVSYPAPTYYAHLAAFRARHYLEGVDNMLHDLDKIQRSLVVQENIRADRPMYFV